MAEKSHDDGGFIRSYAFGSWIVLRLYGAAFCGVAYLGYQWIELDHPLLSDMVFGFPPLQGIAAIGAVGVILFVPFLLPRFIAKPRSIGAGLLKAGLIAALSVWLYVLIGVVLKSGVIAHGRELQELVPILLKCLAGLSITGSILVGFVGQMTRTPKEGEVPGTRQRVKKSRRTKAAPVPKSAKARARAGWMPEESDFNDKAYDDDALRALRQSRMPS